MPEAGDFDLILVATAHDEYRKIDFSGFKIPVVDCRNCIKDRPKLYYQA